MPDPTALADLPILTSGSSDPGVELLGRALDKLGYPNSVSRGENPNRIVDETIVTAVRQFRIDHDVHEDPSAYVPAEPTYADAHIGPNTTGAIIEKLLDLLAQEEKQNDPAPAPAADPAAPAAAPVPVSVTTNQPAPADPAPSEPASTPDASPSSPSADTSTQTPPAA